MKILLSLLLSFGMFSNVVTTVGADAGDTGSAQVYGRDPLNATYLIEGRAFRLIDGGCETAAAPGSATRITTAVLGRPVYADLTGDGREDAAVLLVHDPGGSGTFYYVAAAVNVDNRYQVTNTVLLGDRIEPRRIRIGIGGVTVHFADRRPDEPMSAAPTVDRFVFLMLNDNRLEAVTPFFSGERILEGWVTMSHEVRSFEPCGGPHALWLTGDPAVLRQITAAYRETLPEGGTHGKLLMILGGETDVGP